MKPAAETLSISEESCGPLWQVTAWPETIAQVEERVATACGCDAPAAGVISDGARGTAIRVGPTSWWVLEPKAECREKLGELAPEKGSVLDMTGNRRRFRVSAEKARDCMMRLAPIDFRDSAFPDGRFVSTLVHHMSVQIARRGADWELYVTPSFARTLSELLDETAAQWA